MRLVKVDAGIQRWVDKIGDLELDPYSASEQVIELLRNAREQERDSRKRTRK